jgi:hypothetical protein
MHGCRSTAAMRHVVREAAENHLAAFVEARSRRARVWAGANQALSLKTSRKDYTSVLIGRLTEMVGSARGSSAKEKVERHKAQEMRLHFFHNRESLHEPAAPPMHPTCFGG